MNKPGLTNTYFDKYITVVPQDNIDSALSEQDTAIKAFLESISEEKSTYAYAEGKWTLKEMLLHMSDTERIFAYRALAFARGEKQVLPGFDENEFAGHSKANNRTWADLKNEFLNLRRSTTDLLLSIDNDIANLSGTAGTNTISVAAFAFTIVGHFYHHEKVAKERYF